MSDISSETKLLVSRLKSCNVDEILQNPTLMLKYLPVSDPDNETTIFDDVYRLLNDSLLFKTYKFRVFYFLNTFLSSTKVPAYVIATYIKRLSRLSLKAKPRTLVTLLRLIGNLLLRHPMLIILRDRVDDKARDLELEGQRCTLRSWLEDDPFDEDTRDLKNSKSMDSCIWELMPLRYHLHPRVRKAASYLSEQKLPDMEFDLNDMVR